MPANITERLLDGFACTALESSLDFAKLACDELSGCDCSFRDSDDADCKALQISFDTAEKACNDLECECSGYQE